MAKQPTAENAVATRLVATLTCLPDAAALDALPAEVEWLEVRADRWGKIADDDLRRLRRSREGGRNLLYTLRSRDEGGAGPGAPEERQPAILSAAASDLYDLIDLEAERDLLPEILDAVPAERRLLSWHGPASTLPELEQRFEAMARTRARAYKLIPAADQPGDEIAPLALLASLGRSDVTAFATGEIASWTRPVAAVLGASFLFGSVRGEDAGAPGQMSVERLVEDFHLPELPPIEWLAGLVGAPVEHSLSPRLHNRGYRALGIPALYVPFHVDRFGDFWLEVVEPGRLDELGLPLRGLSVTAPHKEIALAVAGAASPRAQSIGGANTLVRTSHGASGPVWEAESTDPEGVLGPLEELGLALPGLAVAVVGVGGAGRAVAAGLLERDAELTLVNRTVEKGRKVAAELEVPFLPLEDFDPSPYRVVVNATALGHHGDDPLPFDPARTAPDAVVVDMVYDRRRETLLARAARAAGRAVVDGKEVLAAQAFEQFRLMTGEELPRELARHTVGLIGAPSGSPRPAGGVS